MLLTAIVFQALAASLAISSASAHSQKRARRQDGIEARQVPALPVPGAGGLLGPSLLEPVVSPVGKIASTLLPGGVTALPAVNTLVSSLAMGLSSALPVAAPALSLVTQIVSLGNFARAACTRAAGSGPLCDGLELVLMSFFP